MNTLQATLNKFARATKNEFYDPTYNGGDWVADHAELFEPIDDVALNICSNYGKASKQKSGKIGGFKFYSWEKAKTYSRHKNAGPVSVIDLGIYRLVVGADMMDYKNTKGEKQ